MNATTTARSRRVGVTVLLVVGGLCAALGLLATHLNRQLFDGPTFADNVDAIRHDDRVAEQIGHEISWQIVSTHPDLAALRPLIDQVSIRTVDSELLSVPVREAARSAHAALTQRNSDALVLRISDAGAVVTAVIAVVAPDRAPVSTDISVTLAQIGGQELSDAAMVVAARIDVLAWVLPLVAVLSFAAAIALSRRRWTTAGSVGRTMMWAAGGVGVVLLVGAFVVRRFEPDTLTPAVARAAWAVIMRPLWWSVAVLAVAGLAVALASDSSAPEALAERARRTRALLVRPQTTAGLVARIVVAVIVGVAAIADPLGVIEPLVVLGGVGLVLYAVVELSRLAASSRTAPAASGEPRRGLLPRPAVWAVLAVVAAAIVGGVVVQARPGAEVPVVVVDRGAVCNGHAELCDRRFDEVAYAGSHNAMSVLSEPGWFLAEQTDPIRSQLDQGVRALLVDVWPGRASGGVVRTAAGSYAEAAEIARRDLGPEVVDAALRVANSVAGQATGPEQLYMCHGLCETGSTPFRPTLEQLRGWLLVNPTEVVTLFIEDHVDATLIADDIVAAGLSPLLVTPPAVGEPWPTLGELVAADRRLVVMLENGDGGTAAPWLVNGFAHTGETPYTFPTVDDFSCAPNRGPADASLLLLNHWLSGFTSLASDADLVNSIDVLLPRARQCEEERGQIPNFVAVNYVSRGDLFEVVDILNGVADG